MILKLQFQFNEAEKPVIWGYCAVGNVRVDWKEKEDVLSDRCRYYEFSFCDLSYPNIFADENVLTFNRQLVKQLKQCRSFPSSLNEESYQPFARITQMRSFYFLNTSQFKHIGHSSLRHALRFENDTKSLTDVANIIRQQLAGLFNVSPDHITASLSYPDCELGETLVENIFSAPTPPN